MTPQSDQTKIELIGKDISYIQKDIAEIKSSIDKLSGVYITKLQFDDFQKSVELRLDSEKKSRRFFSWVVPIVSSILTAIVTFLSLFYVQNAR